QTGKRRVHPANHFRCITLAAKRSRAYSLDSEPRGRFRIHFTLGPTPVRVLCKPSDLVRRSNISEALYREVTEQSGFLRERTRIVVPAPQSLWMTLCRPSLGQIRQQHAGIPRRLPP